MAQFIDTISKATFDRWFDNPITLAEAYKKPSVRNECIWESLKEEAKEMCDVWYRHELCPLTIISHNCHFFSAAFAYIYNNDIYVRVYKPTKVETYLLAYDDEKGVII